MALLLACALCLSNAAPAGQIAFVAGTEQEDQCVSILDVATGAVRAIGPGQRDGAPRWSPDGQWLAFETQQPEGMGIHVVGADGTGGRLLEHAHAWNRHPRWAPDGKRLVYSAEQDTGMAQVLVVHDLETGTETVWGGEQTHMYRPTWLPTNKLMLALSADDELEWEGVDTQALLAESENGMLLSIGLTGETGALSSEIFLSTRSQSAPLLAVLSRDSLRYEEWAIESNRKGTQLAFESNDGGDREIFVLGKRGVADVSNHHAADWNPVWSNDGTWLAFESFRGGHRGVYRAFPDNARVFAVAAPTGCDCWAPTWSPDDDYIVFVSNQTGFPELFLAAAGGGETTQLTNQNGVALAPAWRPETD